MSYDLMQQKGGSIDQTGHRAALFFTVLYIDTCFLTKKNIIYNRIYIVLFASAGPGLNQQGQLSHTDTVIDQQRSGKKNTSAQNTRHTHTHTLTLTNTQQS